MPAPVGSIDGGRFNRAERAMPTRTVSSALRTLEISRTGLEAVIRDVADGELGRQLSTAVALIRGSTGRLIVTGVGKSGHIGRKLAATMASTGTPSYFVHPTEATHGDLGMIAGDDVVLALSWSGESAELAGVIAHAKRFGIGLIGMTAGPDSTLARASAVALILPRIQEACPHGLAPTTSTLVQLAVGDALAIALLEDKGFTALDFKVFHPGGKLGAKLKFVRDLMHGTEALPLLPIGAMMRDAIVTMSAGGFGVTGVVTTGGALAGVITDGDLRRNMTDDILTRRVEDVMSANPTVVAADVVAGEALKLMQTRRISVLFVVDGDRPIGIVHTLDFLRAGVV
jgi:arabinose-5-phosphate isomerase